jgi:hypothetical protein
MDEPDRPATGLDAQENGEGLAVSDALDLAEGLKELVT